MEPGRDRNKPVCDFFSDRLNSIIYLSLRLEKILFDLYGIRAKFEFNIEDLAKIEQKTIKTSNPKELERTFRRIIDMLVSLNELETTPIKPIDRFNFSASDRLLNVLEDNTSNEKSSP